MLTEEKILKMRENLADYIGVTAEDVTYNGNNIFEVSDGHEYLVFTQMYNDRDSEQSARDAAIDSVKNLYDEIGITGFNLDYLGGIDAFVETEWFADALREDMEFYVEDIKNEWTEEGITRLDEEMIDAKCETEEEYIDYLVAREEDPVEWFKFNFGLQEFNETVEREGLIDIDKFAEAVVDCDGCANILASYDGHELELDDDMYAYRVN